MSIAPCILIRSAAGPRIGYGHLVRARTLSRALGADVRVSVRGVDAAVDCARRLGLPLAPRALGHAIATLQPALVVIDDPSARAARLALATARAAGVPVASIHDLGIAPIASDLVVDGTIAPMTAPAGACIGPRFAVLDPHLTSRAAAARRRGDGPVVLIALGGGPRVRFAALVARAVLARVPGVRIRIAAGLQRTGATLAVGAAGRGEAPESRITWLGPLPTLAGELRACDVAVLAGGVTLYEACALGVPAVAVPVVEAQRPTVAGFAARHAVLAASSPAVGRRASSRSIAEHVATLVARPELARRQAHAAQRIVDGRGAARVARALVQLAARASRHAGAAGKGHACAR